MSQLVVFSPVTAVASSDDDVRSNKGTATHEASTHAPGEHDLVGELAYKAQVSVDKFYFG